LASDTVVLTRSVQDNFSLEKILTASGLKVVIFPCIYIRFVPSDQLFLPGSGKISDYDVLAFTSRNGIRGFGTQLADLKESSTVLAAVGPGTAGEICRATERYPDIVSTRQTGVDLAREIVTFLTHLPGASKCISRTRFNPNRKTVLHVRGDTVNPEFKRTLTDNNIHVDELIVYENIEPDYPEISLSGSEIVVLTSPLAAKRFSEHHGTQFTAIAIGPVTQAYLTEHGFTNVYKSDDSTNNALVRCILQVIQHPDIGRKQ